MTSQACDCAVLKERNAALQAQNEKLMAEIRKVKTENGTMRLLVKEMRLLREREPSESSESDSAGEEDDYGFFRFLDEEGYEDDLDVVFPPVSLMDDDNTASENAALVPDENEKNDPNGLDPIWKVKGVWRCANCQKEIRGERTDRVMHIITHQNSKVSCPFNGCKMLCAPKSLRCFHIPRYHNVKYQDLPQAMKDTEKSERAKLFANAKKFERKFFPKTNIREVFGLKNTKCKMCGAIVTSPSGQRAHIASHLNLQLSCPVDGCNDRYELAKMYPHLRFFHAPMSQEIKEKWRKARNVCLRAAREGKDAYF